MPKTNPTKLAAAALFATIAAASFAADQKVENLLSQMRDAYKSIKAATYQDEGTVQSQNGELKLSCNMAYLQPNMARALIKGLLPDNSVVTIVCDGKTITASVPGQVLPSNEYSLDNLAKAVPLNLEGICFWDWDRQLSTTPGKNMANSTFKIIDDEEWNGKHWIVLEETAAKDAEFVRYFIDPKTHIIWRTNAKNLDTKKDELDMHLTRLDTKADLDASMFKGS